jgi:hypothetical protein
VWFKAGPNLAANETAGSFVVWLRKGADEKARPASRLRLLEYDYGSSYFVGGVGAVSRLRVLRLGKPGFPKWEFPKNNPKKWHIFRAQS